MDSTHSEGPSSPGPPPPPMDSPSPTRSGNQSHNNNNTNNSGGPTHTKARRRPSKLVIPKRTRNSKANLYSPEGEGSKSNLYYSPDDVTATSGRKIPDGPTSSPSGK
eukprot:scaffold101_cov123-Cylindrotheca_fusiformis.AAC.17